MSLTEVTLQHFRNVQSLTLTPCSGVNVIYGENGSGKTTLLEAIHYLSHGRSFRTNKHTSVIQHQQADFVLHAKKSSNNLILPLGLRRTRKGETDIRIQGKTSRRLADLASLMPVQVITPESYSFFFGGPKERRAFVDLGVFHVEHEFYSLWQNFNKVLKHRNALLKQKPPQLKEMLKLWDKEFVKLSVQICALRNEYIVRFKRLFFDKLCTEFPLIKEVDIDFYAGWNEAQDLQDVLADSLESDLYRGYTSKGPHKADLIIKSSLGPVEAAFSRGQLKLLLYALKVAQNSLIDNETGKQSILLIDDLPSELSEDTKQQIGMLLKQSQAQVFITAIEPESVSAVLDMLDKPKAMFHVKHGELITR